MTPKPTLQKSGADYLIVFKGQTIGTIHRAWFRNGGNSWTHNGLTGQKTLQACLADFIQRRKREL